MTLARLFLAIALCAAPALAFARNQGPAPSEHFYAFSVEHCMQQFAKAADLTARQVPKFCGCVNLKTREVVPKQYLLPIVAGLMQGKELAPKDAEVIDGFAEQCRSEVAG